MGKAQSKRSVDITTDPKKDGVIEEGTGEMKKIEDVDQLKPQVNGDTQHNDNEVQEKDKVASETTGETENEKDLSTEKEQSSPTTIDAKAQVEGAGDASITAPVVTSENGGDELLDESKGGTSADTSTTTTTAAETPDSSKKPKKEKVKKKWSFRSISFGKKDKQKPSKKDDANTSAVNGECEKVPEESTEEPTAEKKDETAAASTAAAEPSTETTPAVAVEAAAAAAAPTTTTTATVATPESPKDEIPVTTAAAVTVEKPIEKLADDIAVPITNGTTTTTAEPKIDEITENLAAVKINNDKIDENVETVPEIQKDDDTMNTSTQLQSFVAAAPVVVDDVITTNGNNHNIDDDIKINGDNNDVVTATVDGTTEQLSSPKLNGSSESPKIEVKDDIITTTTTTIKNIILSNQDNNNQIIDSPPVIVNNINNNNNNNSSNNIVAQNNDNNNKNIQPLSYPPPPLPCSLPPSQVMVFALSDNTQNQTEPTNDHKQTVADIIDETKIDEPISTVYEKLATTIEEFIPIPDPILPEQIIHKVENIKEIECKLPENDIPTTIKSIEQEENIKNLVNLSTNIEEIDMEQHSLQIPNEELTKNELIIPETIDIITPVKNHVEIESSTTALQEIDIEQHPTQIPEIELSKNEVIIPEINDIPIPQLPITPKSIADTITTNELSSIINDDDDLPTPPPSPIQEMINDKITTENDSTIPTPPILRNVEIEEIDVFGITPAEALTMIGIKPSLDLDKMTGSSEIILITAEQGVQVSDDEVKQEQQQQQQQNHQQQQNKQKQQQQQQKRNKENGVGENHAETSATESLNGGVEHKTIEEIKAENQQIDKIVPSEVTQESATVTE